MSAHDVKMFGDQIAASRLESRFAQVKATSLIRLVIEDLYPGRVALVSSFGADAAALLHMVSRVDKATPVIFVDTGQHFPETLAYRDQLCEIARPDERGRRRAARRDDRRGGPGEVPVRQRSGPLLRDPQGPAARRGDGGLRRLDHRPQGLPERDARDPAAVRGRGRAGQDQSAGRLERDGHLDYIAEAGLPRHPLVAKGFPSIGCLPCTSPVKPGEDERAGRWRGRGKTECGIHVGVLDAGADI